MLLTKKLFHLTQPLLMPINKKNDVSFYADK